MRHGKKFNHLGRKKAHRSALLSNMACSLIEHKRINTTVAKAKALRVYVEPLITKSKDDSTHSRRTVFSYLKDKYAVSELFREVAPKIAERPGGYTRIIKTGFRQGDAAEMCMIELVDFNEIYGANTGAKKKRSRRGGAKKKSAVDGAVEVEVSEDANEVLAEKSEQLKDSTNEIKGDSDTKEEEKVYKILIKEE
jgi:large subunit ribosomal protein L17